MQYLQDLPDELDSAIRALANRTDEERTEISKLRLKQKKMRKMAIRLTPADTRILNEIYRVEGKAAGERRAAEIKRKAELEHMQAISAVTARLAELGPPHYPRVEMVRILLREALAARGIEV